MHRECIEQVTEEILCYETTDPPHSFAKNVFGSLRPLRYIWSISKTATQLEKLPIFCEKIIRCVIVYDQRNQFLRTRRSDH